VNRHDDLAIVGARRIVGAIVLLMAGAVLVGWVPFEAYTVAAALFLVALALLL